MKTMVWLDFGGVLSPSVDCLFDTYAHKTGVPVAGLKEAMNRVAYQMGVPMLAPVELALISEREWVQRICDELAVMDPKLDLGLVESDFGRQWFAGHQVNQEMRQLAVDLKSFGVPVGILTNNVKEWEPYWRKMVDLDDVVDDIVDSYKVGSRKPDPEIFALAAKRNDVHPTECVIVDDLEENCHAAQEVGWMSVHHLWTQQSCDNVLEIVNRRLF